MRQLFNCFIYEAFHSHNRWADDDSLFQFFSALESRGASTLAVLVVAHLGRVAVLNIRQIDETIYQGEIKAFSKLKDSL